MLATRHKAFSSTFLVHIMTTATLHESQIMVYHHFRILDQSRSVKLENLKNVESFAKIAVIFFKCCLSKVLFGMMGKNLRLDSCNILEALGGLGLPMSVPDNKLV